MDKNRERKCVQTAQYKCTVRVRGATTGATSCSARGKVLKEMNGTQVLLSADSFDMHFNGQRGMCSLSFWDIKEFKTKRGFLFKNPGIAFTTYHGQRFKINQFENKQAHKELVDKFIFAFDRVHKGSSTHSRDWAEYHKAIDGYHCRSSGVFLSCRESSSSLVHVEDDNGSAATTIPAGDIRVFKNVHKILSPVDNDIEARPRREASLKWDPGCHFTLKHINVEQFFDLFWADGAPGFFLEQDLKLDLVTRWTEETPGKALRRRRLHVTMPVEPNPLVKLPDFTRVHNEHWITQWPSDQNGGVLIIEGAATAHDVPFGGTFQALDHWTISPVPGHHAVKVEHKAGVWYKSRFSFARTFRGQCVSDSIKFGNIFAQHAKAFTAQHVENSRREFNQRLSERLVLEESVRNSLREIVEQNKLQLPIEAVQPPVHTSFEADNDSPSSYKTFDDIDIEVRTSPPRDDSAPIQIGILSNSTPPVRRLTRRNILELNGGDATPARLTPLLTPRTEHVDVMSPGKMSSIANEVEVENVIGGDQQADIAPAWTCARVLYSTIAFTKF